MAEEAVERGYAKLVGRRQLEQNEDGTGPPTDVLEEPLEKLITALPAKLGREGGEKLEPGNGSFVVLGNAKSISRHHATIEWDYKSGQYRIECHSKNGMLVNRKHYTRDEYALIRNESAIRIGPCSFYFYLPQSAAQDDKGPSEEEEEDEEEETMAEGDGDRQGGDESVDDAQSKASGPKLPPPSRKSDGAMTYADMVLEAFGSADMKEKGEREGLTAAEVATWLVQKYPDYGEADKRQKLQAGIQNAFSRRYVKQEAVPGAPRGARWKYDPEGAAAKAANRPSSRKTGSQGTPSASSAAARGGAAAAAVVSMLPKAVQSVGESSAFDESDIDVEDDDEGGAPMEVEPE